jgi:LysM repeat protein
MGLLNSVATKAANVVGINTSVSLKSPPGPDFDGFRVYEVVNGKEFDLPNNAGYGFELVGPFMPQVPFEFGGSQRIVKEYYAGSKEPTVQVLGSQENDVIIRGAFKLKKINQPGTDQLAGASGLAEAMQRQVDAVRLRGNLLRIQMGEWKRWGFMEECKFNLKRLVEIEYEIKFTIIGFNKPTNTKFTEAQPDDLIAPNKDLINASTEILAAARNYPDSLPLTLAEFLNGKISDVASVVATVTGFVDGIIVDADALLGSANRALGLIKYTRAYIARTIRTLSAISYTASNLGTAFASEADKTSALIRNAKFNNDLKSGLFNMTAFLAQLQAKFQKIAETLPVARHLVVDGDTLQKISIKHYGTADNWQKIMKHNRMTSTDLTRGAVLEIPR